MNQKLANQWLGKFEKLMPLNSTVIVNVVSRDEINERAHSECRHSLSPSGKPGGIALILIADDLSDTFFGISQIAIQYCFAARNEAEMGNDEVDNYLGALLYFAVEQGANRAVDHIMDRTSL